MLRSSSSQKGVQGPGEKGASSSHRLLAPPQLHLGALWEGLEEEEGGVRLMRKSEQAGPPHSQNTLDLAGATALGHH